MPHAVNPELSARLPGFPDPEAGDSHDAREPDLPGVTIEDCEVPGRHGAPAVPVRVYRPARGSGPWPAVLQLHAGGFVTGDLDTDHTTASAIAAAVGAVVVSVGYRLAPEHPHPAAVADCYGVLLWLAESAGDLGVDPTRIAVSGQDAGGGLAAAVALLARDCGGPAPALQVLGSPMLDDRLATEWAWAAADTRDRRRHDAERRWAAYLGTEAGGPLVSAYAAPARGADLARLPPAYVTASQLDPVRDEALEYARRLAQANVPVELHLYPETFPGAAFGAVSRRRSADLVDALRRALAAAPAGVP
ncbi:alpha/beta hydrolase fold domain-containing protein [Amycolatopsis sp. NPDC004368]